MESIYLNIFIYAFSLSFLVFNFEMIFNEYSNYSKKNNLYVISLLIVLFILIIETMKNNFDMIVVLGIVSISIPIVTLLIIFFVKFILIKINLLRLTP